MAGELGLFQVQEEAWEGSLTRLSWQPALKERLAWDGISKEESPGPRFFKSHNVMKALAWYHRNILSDRIPTEVWRFSLFI